MMKPQNVFFLTIGLLAVIITSSVEAAWTMKDRRLTHIDGGWVVKDGSIRKAENTAILSVQEHYRLGCEAFNSEDWECAAKHFNIVVENFPSTSKAQDSLFFLGLSYYYMNEHDLSNDTLSQYLKCQNDPKYFQEAIEYKFYIAEKFRGGTKRRLWGVSQMPKWASGKEIALEIYDEVIAAVPSHDIAARAHFSRGCLLLEQKEYRDSIEAFTTVIKRYPKNELAPESFLSINKVYLEQSQREFQNPDLLAFAEMNLSKFEEMFPGEERLEAARSDVLNIKEVYAKGLYDTGHFYERIRQPQAAVIYYQKARLDFPETTVAIWCRQRLKRLCPNALEVPEKPKDFEFNEVSA